MDLTCTIVYTALRQQIHSVHVAQIHIYWYCKFHCTGIAIVKGNSKWVSHTLSTSTWRGIAYIFKCAGTNLTCRSGRRRSPGMVRLQQALQKIRPHILQWCRRRNILNFAPHSEHSLHALSGIQYRLRSEVASWGGGNRMSNCDMVPKRSL